MFYIAIRKGDWWSREDLEIMLATGSMYVHAEILVVAPTNKNNAVSFGAWQGEFPTFQGRKPHDWMPEQNYVYFKIPLLDDKQVWDFLIEINDACLQYTTGWECILPEWVVNFTETDINPLHQPSTWKKVFCSQVILLFLKRCLYMGWIPPDWNPIQNVHSFHCSPGILFQLCQQHCVEPLSSCPVAISSLV